MVCKWSRGCIKQQRDLVKRHGVWLGTIERTDEVLIGLARGVVKCRIVNRSTPADRWNKDVILGMQGTPWEPIPGRRITHIHVEIYEHGQEVQREDETNRTKKVVQAPKQGDQQISYTSQEQL